MKNALRTPNDIWMIKLGDHHEISGGGGGAGVFAWPSCFYFTMVWFGSLVAIYLFHPFSPQQYLFRKKTLQPPPPPASMLIVAPLVLVEELNYWCHLPAAGRSMGGELVATWWYLLSLLPSLHPASAWDVKWHMYFGLFRCYGYMDVTRIPTL